jgi:hypothetical protein
MAPRDARSPYTASGILERIRERMPLEAFTIPQSRLCT